VSGSTRGSEVSARVDGPELRAEPLQVLWVEPERTEWINESGCHGQQLLAPDGGTGLLCVLAGLLELPNKARVLGSRLLPAPFGTRIEEGVPVSHGVGKVRGAAQFGWIRAESAGLDWWLTSRSCCQQELWMG